MRFMPLIWSMLWRKKYRTLLTFGSIAIAFLLFALLQGINVTFKQTVDDSNVSRLVVMDKVSITEPLPYAYVTRAGAVPGVTGVAHYTWFGAYYKDPRNFIAAFPTDPKLDAQLNPERVLSTDQALAFSQVRTGALVGKKLAERFGWKVGDHVQLHSTIWVKRDRSSDWEFDIVGIYEVPSARADENSLYFNYQYFDDSRAFGNGSIGWLLVKVADPAQSATVAAAIDRTFANSGAETRTSTEKEFQRAFLKQIGDIDLIVTYILVAVFLALVFAVGSLMIQSLNERLGEFAVLKTLGFSDSGVFSLCITESLLLCLTAAAVGTALAALLFMLLKDTIGEGHIPAMVLAQAMALAAFVALATGLLPALRMKRLNIANAVRA